MKCFKGCLPQNLLSLLLNTLSYLNYSQNLQSRIHGYEYTKTDKSESLIKLSMVVDHGISPPNESLSNQIFSIL